MGRKGEEAEQGKRRIFRKSKNGNPDEHDARRDQGRFFTQLEEGAGYQTTVDKVKLLVSNKTDLGGAIPMDIGRVEQQHQCGGYHGQAHDGGFDEGQLGVNGISWFCHGCGGWGHIKRECPTQNGEKGKGGNNYQPGGKGPTNYNNNNNYKGGWQQKGSFSNGNGKGDFGKGGKQGGGKGYQGTCFTCGKICHKA